MLLFSGVWKAIKHRALASLLAVPGMLKLSTRAIGLRRLRLLHLLRLTKRLLLLIRRERRSPSSLTK